MHSPTASTKPDAPYQTIRKASVDSALSNSSHQSHGAKLSQDLSATESSEIAGLIASTGSPEAVIGRLLREKQSTAGQNAQLWRLVEKQRAMILGLNKDLERLAKDKERYKKKLKDHIAQVPSGLDLSKRSDAEAAPSRAVARGEDQTSRINTISRDTTLQDLTSQGSTTEADGSPDVAKNLEEQKLNHRKTLPMEPSFEGFEDHEAIEKAAVSNSTRKPSKSQTVSPLHSPNKEGVPSPRGFAQSRANPAIQRNHPPSLDLAQASPVSGEMKNSDDPTPARKPPPAPLDLSAPNSASSHLHQTGAANGSDSDYDDVLEIDEIPSFERGRRKTREEDDRLREATIKKESQHRSRSKKSKKSKSIPPPADSGQRGKAKPAEAKSSAPRHAVPIAPPSNLAQLAQANSLASVLNKAPLTAQRFVNAPQPSPGLPASPRPSGRPLNSPAPRKPREGSNLSGMQSPPMSAASNFPGMPLSPRAPRQPFPLPPNTPMSLASPGMIRPGLHNIGSPLQNQFQRQPISMGPDVSNILQTQYRPIYRGLVSDQYPGLLLPPNALPLVLVKVSSSRMKPSRASYVSGKPKSSDDDDVFTLGVFARSDKKELWRVEKDMMALPQLDQQLRRTSTFSAKLPDRSLFIGHAPARMDARRAALDEFFDAVLDTQMDEKTALDICQFLSSDAIEPSGEVVPASPDSVSGDVSVVTGPGGRRRKEGYLTKRGKNFGGWKARYFFLDGPHLRYYESPGGAHMGTIKLQNAQIGKQSAQQSNDSPSRTGEDDDNEYRHAFLVLEPKKKDSNSHVRHTLCAENDEERDEWVEALLQYVDYNSEEEEEGTKPAPVQEKSAKSSGLHSMKMFVTGRKDGREADSPSAASYHEADALRSLSYDETVQADAPTNGTKSAYRDQDTPSPPLISKPTNGSKIEDAEAWGNKSSAPVDKKESKKRNLFGFRGRTSSDSNSQLNGGSMSSLHQSTERSSPVRAVFGLALPDAAEHCRPNGVNVYLPAVVYRSIEYLEGKSAALEEGIFRQSGSNTVIKGLRERFNTEGDVNLLAEQNYFDIHAVASLLKLYLRELPVSILTRELHLDFIRVLGKKPPC
jgi:RalA-binding protein 1